MISETLPGFAILGTFSISTLPGMLAFLRQHICDTKLTTAEIRKGFRLALRRRMQDDLKTKKQRFGYNNPVLRPCFSPSRDVHHIISSWTALIPALYNRTMLGVNRRASRSSPPFDTPLT